MTELVSDPNFPLRTANVDRSRKNLTKSCFEESALRQSAKCGSFFVLGSKQYLRELKGDLGLLADWLRQAIFAPVRVFFSLDFPIAEKETAHSLE